LFLYAKDNDGKSERSYKSEGLVQRIMDVFFNILASMMLLTTYFPLEALGMNKGSWLYFWVTVVIVTWRIWA